MTEIKIKRLSLENFKKHKHFVLELEGRSASIYGANYSGKTSVYDALTWLLFGKSSDGKGSKNFEVKPIAPGGEIEDHDALTVVEAVLDVSGEDVTLRRTYKEVWTTKRGSSQATYDGNTSGYYINGVPCKMNAFQDKVNELVSEDTFRLLTSVSHFAAGISWQDRRAVLFKVAGVMEDRDLLATNEAFAPLVESMGRLSIEDYKKKLLAEKKGFVGSKTEIPARISECEKTIADIAGLDFAGAKAEVEALNARKESLAAQVLAIEHDSAMDAKRMEIREAQLELSALENENKAYRASQDTGSSNVYSLKNRLTSLQSKLSGKKLLIENERAYIADLDKRITEYRNRWISLNGETFTGGSCPTCGQNLPAAQLQAAREQFEANKQKRLDDILQTANSYKESKAQAESRLARTVDEIAQLEAEITELTGQITATEANVVEIKDMEGYAGRKNDINTRINAMSGELADMASNSAAVKGRLREEIAAVQSDINAQQAIISKESLLEYSRQRVEQLREDAKNAAECLEAIEKMLYLMEEYSRYKTRFVEDGINGLFRIARFRLFHETNTGGIEERCDVTTPYGILYDNASNSEKINLGIDIINTLSTVYGVRVPLFVDNAESVTNLEKCGSQIIRLVVSKEDKELRVDYGTEN